MIPIRLTRGLWQYDPSKLLGTPGGFGAVYAGVGPANESVAVKKLHLSAAAAAHRELAIAEALARRACNHVMPVLDAGQDAESDGYFVVMPVASQSLQDVIDAQGTMTEVEAIPILCQVARGLAEVPDIVHRDLKPANVLLLDGTWRVADFGIARFVEDSTSAHTLKDCLSPQFAAPEQWRLERATAATDVYALGCTAYVLLTGAPPFAGSTPELQDKHLHAVPPDLAGCSPQLRALLIAALRKVPEARPRLSRVIQVLDAAAAGAAPVTDKALGQLAVAAATYEHKVAEADAARERAIAAQAKRHAIAEEGRRALAAIFDELADRIAASVPGASVEKTGGDVQVRVGEASLELNLGAVVGTLPEGALPRSKWDVVCGAVVGVTQQRPFHKRAANLWFTRQQSKTGEYRWYEVGYGANALTGKAFEFEPTAVSPEVADRAHWAGMDVVRVAYGPHAVDVEDVESFFQRWTAWLAAACEGRLGQLPR